MSQFPAFAVYDELMFVVGHQKLASTTALEEQIEKLQVIIGQWFKSMYPVEVLPQFIGPLWKESTSRFATACERYQSSGSDGPKFCCFSTHDVTITALLLSIWPVFREMEDFTEFCADVGIELWASAERLRLSFSETVFFVRVVHLGEVLQHTHADADGFCTLAKWNEFLSPYLSYADGATDTVGVVPKQAGLPITVPNAPRTPAGPPPAVGTFEVEENGKSPVYGQSGTDDWLITSPRGKPDQPEQNRVAQAAWTAVGILVAVILWLALVSGSW